MMRNVMACDSTVTTNIFIYGNNSFCTKRYRFDVLDTLKRYLSNVAGKESTLEARSPCQERSHQDCPAHSDSPQIFLAMHWHCHMLAGRYQTMYHHLVQYRSFYSEPEMAGLWVLVALLALTGYLKMVAPPASAEHLEMVETVAPLALAWLPKVD